MHVIESTSEEKTQLPIRMEMGEVLCIDIEDIDLFDRNPRRSRNPAYERIKASILANGLDQPLIVTKRPDSDRFMVHAGGNTRLKILKELNAATGDPSFAMVNCIYVAWDSESSVLLAHLRENDLRGDLTFIDKAVAICALEELLDEENGRQSLSIRELQRALSTCGYGISVALISYMRYAVNVLLPVMPVALSEGLGRRQIQKVRQLHRLGKKIWVDRKIGSEKEFAGIFSELCRRHDMPDWQIETLRRAVETEIAEAADASIHSIRMEMECMAAGHSASAPTPEAAPEQNLIPVEPNATESQGADTEVDEGRVLTNVSITMPHDAANCPGELIADIEHRSTVCVDELRFRAFRLAESLARRHGMGDLVVPLTDSGYGFLITDIPPKAIIGLVDDELRATVCTMWWQLLAFSETMTAPVQILDEHIDKERELRAIIRDGKIRLLFERIWIIDPSNFADRFWRRLSQQDWQDWLYLAHTYRELNQLSVSEERPLWESES